MGGAFEYIVYGVYVYSEIEFTNACSTKLVISLSRVDILRIKVEDIKKTC